jgi:hypothetical protein
MADNPTKPSPRARRNEDKSHLKCDFCGRAGHIEDTYWKLRPEKMPRTLKDRSQQISNAKDNVKPIKPTNTSDDVDQGEIAAFTTADVEDFRTKLTTIGSLSTHSSTLPQSYAPANSLSWTRESIGADVRKLWEDKEPMDKCTKRKRPRLLSNTMDAFLVGPV